MTTINSQEDFLRALAENPEWRAAVRAQILGDDVLQLPSRFDAFVEMDAFIEEQKQTNAMVAGFIEEQKQFNASLTASIEELKELNREQKDINARLTRNMDESLTT